MDLLSGVVRNRKMAFSNVKSQRDQQQRQRFLSWDSQENRDDEHGT